MRINMAFWDQTLRSIVGIGATAWAFAGGPVWAYLGLALLATAAFRFDPFYALFRTGTLSGTSFRDRS